MEPRDCLSREGPSKRTRRQWLLALGAGAAAGLAGCSSDGSGSAGDGDSGGSETETEANGVADRQTPADSDGGDSGCPTGSFSYTTERLSALGQEGYLAQCEVPESARIENTGDGTMANGFTAIFDWGGGELTSFSVNGEFSAFPEREGARQPTVTDQVTFVQENSNRSFVRATGEYDVGISGAVILVSEATAGESPPIPRETHVIYEHPEGIMDTTVSINVEPGCFEASERIRRRLVESQQPV